MIVFLTFTNKNKNPVFPGGFAAKYYTRDSVLLCITNNGQFQTEPRVGRVRLCLSCPSLERPYIRTYVGTVRRMEVFVCRKGVDCLSRFWGFCERVLVQVAGVRMNGGKLIARRGQGCYMRERQKSPDHCRLEKERNYCRFSRTDIKVAIQLWGCGGS